MILLVISVVGCGAVGGVFYAFSSFVMPGLKRLPAREGIATMQSVNVTAERPAFLVGFLGTAALCGALAVRGFTSLGSSRSTLTLVGSGLYLAGAVLPTLAYHVPLNNKLAALDPDSPGAVRTWNDYLSGWTRWNHLRAVTGVAAAACLVGALLVRDKG